LKRDSALYWRGELSEGEGGGPGGPHKPGGGTPGNFKKGIFCMGPPQTLPPLPFQGGTGHQFGQEFPARRKGVAGGCGGLFERRRTGVTRRPFSRLCGGGRGAPLMGAFSACMVGAGGDPRGPKGFIGTRSFAAIRRGHFSISTQDGRIPGPEGSGAANRLGTGARGCCYGGGNSNLPGGGGGRGKKNTTVNRNGGILLPAMVRVRGRWVGGRWADHYFPPGPQQKGRRWGPRLW